MIVVKIGGGCLSDEETIARILDLAATRCRGQLIVVSALKGVTDHLIRAMRRAVEDENSVAETLGALRRRHMAVAERLMAKDCRSLAAFGELLGASLKKLERLLYGLSFTRETTPRLADRVSSYGERLSAELLTYTLACRGTPAHCLLPEEIGLVTDGKYGDATADLAATARNFAERARGPIESGGVCIMPGFYGVSAAGEVTTFGRGGSDYSAAVAASALDAERLEVWKDTAGFMSADPRVVPGARLIPLLSFDEAAELSYFGAKILHPRTVEPLRRKKIPIAVKNTLDPDAPGSRIELKGVRTDSGVKSVAHAGDLGLLKIHGSGVGARPGILARVSGALSGSGPEHQVRGHLPDLHQPAPGREGSGGGPQDPGRALAQALPAAGGGGRAGPGRPGRRGPGGENGRGRPGLLRPGQGRGEHRGHQLRPLARGPLLPGAQGGPRNGAGRGARGVFRVEAGVGSAERLKKRAW